jgi:hypothetical protein
MSRTRKAAAVLAAVLLGAATSAGPASASPDDPCGVTLIPVCAFIPALPNLDHDVDLTTNQDPLRPSSLDDGPPGVPDPNPAR